MANTNKRTQILDTCILRGKAQQLETGLKKMVIGQDHAIDSIVKIYQLYESGLSIPTKPIGNFLFLGPTGTGKTRLVEATAEFILQNPRAVVKIDCAEFAHSHEIAKLIGSPPGYLGHRETNPMLSQAKLNQSWTDENKISFVLFDEIEKASDALWNLLLGILDKATLTTGDNTRVDFSKCFIFMTSNLGAKEMKDLLSPAMGFQAFMDSNEVITETQDKIVKIGIDAVKKKFTPEFVNRLDKVVTFNILSKKMISEILNIELMMLQQRIWNSLAHSNAFVLEVSEKAKDFLIKQGVDQKYGARFLQRTLQRYLIEPLSNLIVSEQINGGDIVKVTLSNSGDSMRFSREEGAFVV